LAPILFVDFEAVAVVATDWAEEAVGIDIGFFRLLSEAPPEEELVEEEAAGAVAPDVPVDLRKVPSVATGFSSIRSFIHSSSSQALFDAAFAGCVTPFSFMLPLALADPEDGGLELEEVGSVPGFLVPG
jgi:hypothetical protein